MSPRYSLTLLGLALIVLGLANGGWSLLVLWPGVDFLIACIAHFNNAPGVFCKLPGGSLPFWSWLIFLPLLIYGILVLRIAWILSREPSQNIVTNDLVIGRRLRPAE